MESATRLLEIYVTLLVRILGNDGAVSIIADKASHAHSIFGKAVAGRWKIKPYSL